MEKLFIAFAFAVGGLCVVREVVGLVAVEQVQDRLLVALVLHLLLPVARQHVLVVGVGVDAPVVDVPVHHEDLEDLDLVVGVVHDQHVVDGAEAREVEVLAPLAFVLADLK